MKRREFIAGFGSAVAWPLAARAQQGEPMRRVGILVSRTETAQAIPLIGIFRDGLSKLGWVEGRNLRIDLRLGGEDADRIRVYAAELVSLAPDLIVTVSGAATRAVQQQTHTIPIVIMIGGDVFANGVVKNIAHPEGNTTGFAGLFSSLGGVWLQLLKEVAPQVERVAFIENPQVTSSTTGYFASIDEAARGLAVKAIKMPYRDAADLAHAIDAFAAEPKGGLILSPGSNFNNATRETTLRLSVEHRLPSISTSRLYAAEGGLMSYGSDGVDVVRRASFYVDRILRGAKPGDLPVQFPTKFEFVINLKTAKAIGLTIPESVLIRADEVMR
jgi:putative tryptophan/tyrosine transport system substrate-binding protein